MSETLLPVYKLSENYVVMLSIVVLFTGSYLNRKLDFLHKNHIPPAVSGGLICSAIVACIYLFANKAIHFDLDIRNEFILEFFSTKQNNAAIR